MDIADALQEQIVSHGVRRDGRLFDPIIARAAIEDGIIVVGRGRMPKRADRLQRLARVAYWRLDAPWWLDRDMVFQMITERVHPSKRLNTAALEVVAGEAKMIVEKYPTETPVGQYVANAAKKLNRCAMLRSFDDVLPFFGFSGFRWESVTTEQLVSEAMNRDRLIYIGSDDSVIVTDSPALFDRWMEILLAMVVEQELVK